MDINGISLPTVFENPAYSSHAITNKSTLRIEHLEEEGLIAHSVIAQECIWKAMWLSAQKCLDASVPDAVSCCTMLYPTQRLSGKGCNFFPGISSRHH